MITLLPLVLAIAQSSSADEGEPFVLGQRLSMHSEVLDEERQYLLYRSPFARAGEPVPTLYLLDGSSSFRHVAGLVHSLSGSGILPACLVVAVGNTDRWRDLTPTHTDEARTSGGGARFLEFLERELVPLVEERYPSSGYRVLIGHSLGGLIAIESLMTQSELFDAVISQSPSLEWNGAASVERMRAWLTSKPEREAQLYLSRANEWELRAPFASLVELLRGGPKSLQWIAEDFEDEDHMSVRVIASQRGLRWVFAHWNATPAQVAGMQPHEIEAFYERAALRYEAPRPIPENALLEGAMHALHGSHDPASAIEIASFAEVLFPASGYPPLTLAQALERADEPEEARAAYLRALERLAADDDHHRSQCRSGLARLGD